ncbi:hypothetical protein HMI54_011029 [Coelomomyces lativittatus]|nr:hypothetical protein HMI56_003303 [Coelomomyces lativittatus]KAJ1510249.1 hypothetical protein HMI55_007068 [Coelomomyces lativittatus]KAJ1516051.1 hypothetical protein HMI54_011029 [Coelomomyces lativittatus]
MNLVCVEWSSLAFFRDNQPHDAHEFLNYLLNTLTEWKKTIQTEDSPPSPSSSSSVVTTPVITSSTSSCFPPSDYIPFLFQGEWMTQLLCFTCQNISTTNDTFLDLSIDIEHHTSIVSCLHQICQPEILSQNNKFFCSACDGLHEAEKRINIKKLPPILTLHLKRFKFMEDQQRHVKLMHHVKFPTSFTPFQSHSLNLNPPTPMYHLIAMVVHVGASPHHGHYVTLIKSDTQWLLYDDEQVSVLSPTHRAYYFGEPENDLDPSSPPSPPLHDHDHGLENGKKEGPAPSFSSSTTTSASTTVTPTRTATAYILFYQVQQDFAPIPPSF